MFAKLGKSEFARQEIQFLGHIVAEGQLRVDADKLNKLALWEVPLKTVKQVRQLIGKVKAYCQRFKSVLCRPAKYPACLKYS